MHLLNCLEVCDWNTVISHTDAANGGKPKEAREPKVSHAAANAAEAEKETSKDNNRGGNRNRERHGAGRGGDRAPESGERRPKREFDRRSGTGRGREVSRGGRGAFGAGNPQQDAIDAEKDPKAAIEGAVDGAPDAPAAEEEEAAPAEEVAPAEPEPVTFTLDEFMRKREEARQKLAGVGAVAPRAVNRETEFAGMTTLATALDDYVSGTAAKSETGRKDQRSTGKTQIVDVGFKFQAPQGDRDRESRGGRGEGRGGRGGDREGGRGGRREGRGDGRGGRGEGRGGRGGRGSAPGFNAADFPSL